MPDFLSKEDRSALMSRIRSKNSVIERRAFRLLRRAGIAFRRHVRSLPGHPDIVIQVARLAVFVDSEFWHGRNFRSWNHTLSEKWKSKIEANVFRDMSRRRLLRRLGWRTLRLWGRDLLKRPDYCLRKVTARIAKPVSHLVTRVR